MRRYPSYKDSGVEWIGEIPSHWEETKHKFLIDVLSGYPFKSELFDPVEGFPIIRIRDITSGKIETFYTGEIIEDFIVKKGDLLVGMDGDFNIRWWDSEEGLLNQRCCSIKEGKGVLRRYLFYILPFELQIINDLTYFTTVKHLSVSDIKNTSTVHPSLPEQTQIVSYLDRKTEGIDKLIETKVRKIELLKEYRTSLISKVVTKGLNPNVKMKDSGIEWIGEIPEHWGVKNIKHHSEVNVGLVINPSTYFDEYGTIPIITGKNVKVTGIDLGEVDKITEESNELLWKTKIYEDDLVSMRVGYPGRTSVVKKSENGINCCSVIITRKSKSIISKLLELQLNSKIGEIQVELCQGGMGQKVVNLSDWNEFKVISPPLSEQTQIVSYLDEQTQLIDKNIQTEEKKIELLKEYRQSLISEVVTGKIKVSNDEEVH